MLSDLFIVTAPSGAGKTTLIKKALEYASDKLKDDPYIVMHAVANDHRAFSVASSTLKNGGLRSYVEKFIVQYNVSKQTFVATILFGARQTSQVDHSESALRLLGQSSEEGDDFSTYAKRLIWKYAGVVSSERWRVIESAARKLGIEIPG